jgi:hypothetical protein
MRNFGRTGRGLRRLVTTGGLCAALAFTANVQADVEKGDQNGVGYTNGGWSAETQASIAASAGKYPVLLVFALSDGDYVSDVGVDVVDGRGASVFRLNDTGPMLLIDLPRGDYTVKVERAGKLQSRPMHVGPGTHTKAVFHWPRQ